MSTNNNLGSKVTTQTVSSADLARRYWGSEFNAPDHGAYVFSGNRKFDSTDKSRSGLYGVEVTDGLLIETPESLRNPDMYAGVVLTEGSDKIAQE